MSRERRMGFTLPGSWRTEPLQPTWGNLGKHHTVGVVVILWPSMDGERPPHLGPAFVCPHRHGQVRTARRCAEAAIERATRIVDEVHTRSRALAEALP